MITAVDQETGEIAERTPALILATMRRPFPADAIRSRVIAGGQRITYVSIDHVVDRLNRACGDWTCRVTDHWVETMPLVRKEGIRDVPVYHVVCELEIPGLGARQAIGTAPCEGSEDAGKSAASDALKRAASLFGLPLDGGQG